MKRLHLILYATYLLSVTACSRSAVGRLYVNGDSGYGSTISNNKDNKHQWISSSAEGLKLIELIKANNMDEAATLIEGGAALLEPDSMGKTALYYAIEKGDPYIVIKLLLRGAALLDKDGKPFFPDYSGWNLDRISGSCSCTKVPFKDSDSLYFILSLCEGKWQDMMRLHDALKNIKVPPLCYNFRDSVSHMRYVITDIISPLGPLRTRYYLKPRDTLTPMGLPSSLWYGTCCKNLHTAISESDASDAAVIDVIEHAVNKKGKSCLDSPNSHLLPILTKAIRVDRPKVAAYLIEHGADVNWADEDGETPLDAAILRRHSNIVAMLLLNGAKCHKGKKDYWRNSYDRNHPGSCTGYDRACHNWSIPDNYKNYTSDELRYYKKNKASFPISKLLDLAEKGKLNEIKSMLSGLLPRPMNKSTYRGSNNRMLSSKGGTSISYKKCASSCNNPQNG